MGAPVLTIIHAADVHLDRAFTERGLRLSGRERRTAIRDALMRVVDLARTADALCIAGDLYEHEHVTGDTENMLVAKLGELSCPVLLLPGNHDPLLAGSVYERADWPDNVHVFSASDPEPYELSSEVVIWGIAYTARELRPEVVRSFRTPSDGRIHLLLLHGSLIGSFHEAETDHLPITGKELADTGADFVMLGHYHGGVIRGNACYPGSVEPLTWAETGTHAVNELTVSPGGVEAKLQPINRLFFEEVTLDVTGATSSTDIEERVEARIRPAESQGLTLRVVLEGEVDRATEVNAAQIADRCRQGFGDVILDDRTVPAYELDQIAKEHTVRGRFVAILLERARNNPADAPLALAAARAGLRALDGRGDLVDLGAEHGGRRVA